MRGFGVEEENREGESCIFKIIGKRSAKLNDDCHDAILLD